MVTDEQLDRYCFGGLHSDVGGYPLALIVSDNFVCADCAAKESYTEKQIQDSSIRIYFEGPELLCDCGYILESAYGDPNAEWELPSELIK